MRQLKRKYIFERRSQCSFWSRLLLPVVDMAFDSEVTLRSFDCRRRNTQSCRDLILSDSFCIHNDSFMFYIRRNFFERHLVTRYLNSTLHVKRGTRLFPLPVAAIIIWSRPSMMLSQPRICQSAGGNKNEAFTFAIITPTAGYTLPMTSSISSVVLRLSSVRKSVELICFGGGNTFADRRKLRFPCARANIFGSRQSEFEKSGIPMFGAVSRTSDLES